MQVFRSISAKLVLWFSVLLVVTIAITTGISMLTAFDYVERQVEQKGYDNLNALQLFLSDYKERAMAGASTIAHNKQLSEAVKGGDFQSIIKVTQPLMKSLRLDYIVVTDAKGLVLARTHEPTKLPKPDDSVANQQNIASAIAGKPLVAIEEGKVVKMSIRAGYPLIDETGVIIGAVSAGYTVNEANYTIVDQAKQLFGMEASIYSGKERVSTTLKTSDGSRSIGATISDTAILKTVYEEKQTFRGNSKVDGIDMVSVYSPIVVGDRVFGALGVGVSAASVLALKLDLVKKVLAVGLAMLILAGLINYLIVKRMLSPIRPVVSALQEISQGNLAVNDLHITSNDELGTLSSTLNQMRGNLRGTVRQVYDCSIQVASSSQQLAASADHSAKVATEVGEAVNHAANATEQQLEFSVDASAGAEEMSASIQQIASNAGMVAGVAEKAASAAADGARASDKALLQMHKMAEAVSNSADVISKLGLRSKEIVDIATIISSIAAQTNLLALNAAIESARAGEHGRGFAVVAEEVRKLAEQSQRSAAQISNLINSIIAETGQAVTTMETGKQEVMSGSQVVSEAARSFSAIIAMVNQVADQVRDISVATRQMAAASNRSLASVRSIESSAKSVASQTQSVSASTEEQLAVFQEIAASSHALAQMADTLQMSIVKFKL